MSRGEIFNMYGLLNLTSRTGFNCLTKQFVVFANMTELIVAKAKSAKTMKKRTGTAATGKGFLPK